MSNNINVFRRRIHHPPEREVKQQIPRKASLKSRSVQEQNLGGMISGMSSPPLDLDEAFADFNFCGSWDPTLRVGPNRLRLLQMICLAREGDRSAAAEFADTMYWTLRKAAFESFLRKRGERAIFYSEWFYENTAQLTTILLHDGVQILKESKAWIEARRPWDERLSVLAVGGPFFQPDELERIFVPEDNERLKWYDMVLRVSAEPSDNREAALRAWLAQQGKRVGSARVETAATAARNNLIREGLGAEKPHQEICEVLDKNLIPTTSHMQRAGFKKWVKAWDDPEMRQRVYEIFSKALNPCQGL
jgi:hypothetical protein